MTEPAITVPAPRARPAANGSHRAGSSTPPTSCWEKGGFAELTLDEVAQRAGVSKPTIYRRWPTKGTLVFEAFSAGFLTGQPLPNTGSLRGDLLAALRAWIRVVKGTVTGRTLVGLIAEVQRDPELAAIGASTSSAPSGPITAP